MTTTKGSPVAERAEQLREWIHGVGSVPMAEVTAWFEKEKVPGQYRGLILGYGTGKKRWWKKQGDSLVPDSGSSTGAGPAPPSAGLLPSPFVAVDPSTLESPRDQLEAVAVQLGIAPRPAAAMANYLSQSYDLANPESLWSGLMEVPEVNPSLRKRFWRTWVSFLGIPVPPALATAVEKQTQAAVAGYSPNSNGAKPARRFIAVNGEVLPTEPDDDGGGLSFAQALQAAQLQMSGRLQPDDSKDVIIAVLHEMSEDRRAQQDHALERERMAMERAESGVRPSDGTDGMQRQVDLMMKLIDASSSAARDQFSAALDLIRLQNEHQTARLTDMLDRLGGQLAGRTKNPFAELDEVLPGVGQRLLNSILDPAKPVGVTLRLPGIVGENGQPAAVDLDTYERIRNMERRDLAMKELAGAAPKLLAIGERLARAIERSSNEGSVTDGSDATGVDSGLGPQVHRTSCVTCGIELLHSGRAKALLCPGCKTVQTVDGTVLSLAEPGQGGDGPPAAGVMQEGAIPNEVEPPAEPPVEDIFQQDDDEREVEVSPLGEPGAGALGVSAPVVEEVAVGS